jgi:two-component system, NarL family, response regulator NreC
MENTARKISIAIAEDQLLILHSLVMTLKTIPDFEVCGTARNGKELLDLLKGVKPDIILMDIKMPHMNGVEATRIIQDKTPWIKIIVLSMHTHPSFIKEIIKAGASGFLSKDCAFEELCEAIRSVYEGNTYLYKAASLVLLNNFIHEDEEQNHINTLTASELRIIQLLSEGLTTTKIAGKLGISNKTVERHKSNVFGKLKLQNTAQLIRLAFERGLIID